MGNNVCIKMISRATSICAAVSYLQSKSKKGKFDKTLNEVSVFVDSPKLTLKGYIESQRKKINGKGVY